MTQDHANSKAFLYQLYIVTGGDLDAKVSSIDIGQALGIDENQAGEIAQDLCIQGFAELKTLAGDIGITAEGLVELDVAVPAASGFGPASGLSLGSGPVINAQETEMIQAVLEEIRPIIAGTGQDYTKIEEQVMDLKTIEIQMLSPKPKTAVIREVFRSLRGSLETGGNAELTEKLNALIN